MTDWLLRVGDGENFKNSSVYRIWGIQSTTPFGKHFIQNVKPGDRLWFVKSRSNGRLLAVATYRSHNLRELGPLITTTMTAEELGWTGEGPDWVSDTEVHYTDLYGLEKCEMLTHFKPTSTILKYKPSLCRVDLPAEYTNIVRYSKVTSRL